ncbi:hypothetical protein A5782_17150 [Mycobacterium sp. 852002-40037_SCH5390672]|nr:hypothetical protein A5782_17150 [Mycobacterium sp. 852002-40037_SCH5390672]
MGCAEDLAQRATGIVADYGDVFELQPFDEFGDHPREPRRRAIGVVHGDSMTPERQIWNHTPGMAGQH